MIHAAANGSGLAFSWQMRAWMLLSILRLPAKRWAEVLKDNDHVLPHTEEQCKNVKKRLLREKILEYTLNALGAQSHRTPGGAGHFHTSETQVMPLYMCLASPTVDEHIGESAYPVLPDGRTVKLASGKPTERNV